MADWVWWMELDKNNSMHILDEIKLKQQRGGEEGTYVGSRV